MIAMMLPAAVPMILIFVSAQARRDRRVAVPTWIFVGGAFSSGERQACSSIYLCRSPPNW